VNCHRVFALLFALFATGCNPIPYHQACNLPSLKSDSAYETLDQVGTWGIFSDYCSESLARAIEFRKPYGVIKMEWWGSPHRLYMSARALDDHPLQISGAGVDLFQATPDSDFMDQYQYVVTFAGQSFLAPPPDQSINLEILESRGEVVGDLELVYSTKRCTCVYFDAI
jgi:hypothetical protein